MSWKIIKQGLCAALLMGTMALQSAAAFPIVTTSALPAAVSAGDNIGVDVYVQNASDLFAWQFTFLFNPAVLQSAGATEGDFLTRFGGTSFFDASSVDNVGGSIIALASSFGPVGVSGAGLLAHFDFTAISSGAAGLQLTDLLFLDSNFDDLGARVPEPSAWLLLAIGLAGMGLVRRRV